MLTFQEAERAQAELKEKAAAEKSQKLEELRKRKEAEFAEAARLQAERDALVAKASSGSGASTASEPAVRPPWKKSSSSEPAAVASSESPSTASPSPSTASTGKYVAPSRRKAA